MPGKEGPRRKDVFRGLKITGVLVALTALVGGYLHLRNTSMRTFNVNASYCPVIGGYADLDMDISAGSLRGKLEESKVTSTFFDSYKLNLCTINGKPFITNMVGQAVEMNKGPLGLFSLKDGRKLFDYGEDGIPSISPSYSGEDLQGYVASNGAYLQALRGPRILLPDDIAGAYAERNITAVIALILGGVATLSTGLAIKNHSLLLEEREKNKGLSSSYSLNQSNAGGLRAEITRLNTTNASLQRENKGLKRELDKANNEIKALTSSTHENSD